ncbi:serine hydrolase domain-containing protein [Brucella anthropi]|uniref:serine hydrolase domain-containing protein n=1 Tax=Brucella anthropi TaxID=529 RepID=UPI00216508BC|nr:serine hydrolase domain-containing protein [Brucella anthropi]MDG9793757.1 beta-lactamase family protein [Brucella anthropi]MDH0583642.1 beta-lactamase family protein [Brucella anthropi]MDH0820160.1 beta-lactamase family protein [Brucella anthropi]MDH2086995.1 beta-lactamase family protein [Brucella anthropi]UVV70885.1 beta-lactamase family protein [Brucella anthropi]
MREMKELLQAYIDRGGVGVQLSFMKSGGVPITFSAGVTNRETNEAVTACHVFKIGSCTKTFVAAALVRLAADGKIDLRNTIESWFPDLPFSREIKVVDLINHRSGLPEFEYDIPMTPDLHWTPRQIVEFAYSVAKPKPPHGQAVYSNTGFVMAGIVIEAVTGLSLGQWVRQAILEPLSLADSWSPATEEFPESRLVRGNYLRLPDLAGRGHFKKGGEMWNMEGLLSYSSELQDSSDLFSFPAAYACGDMVASTADQVRFLSALMLGKIVPHAFLEQMTGEMVPVSFPGTRMLKAGAGLFECQYADRITFGHQGSLPGYVSVMQFDPETQLTLAIASNIGSGDRLSFEANGLHPLMDEVLQLLSDDTIVQNALA